MQVHAPMPAPSHTGKFAQLKSAWNVHGSATSPQVVLPMDSQTHVSMMHAGEVNPPHEGTSVPQGQTSSQYQAPDPGSQIRVDVQPGSAGHSPGLPTQSHVVGPQYQAFVVSSHSTSVTQPSGDSHAGMVDGSHVPVQSYAHDHSPASSQTGVTTQPGSSKQGGASPQQTEAEVHPMKPPSSHSHVVQPSVHMTPGENVLPSGAMQQERSSQDMSPSGSHVQEPQPSTATTTVPMRRVSPSC